MTESGIILNTAVGGTLERSMGTSFLSGTSASTSALRTLALSASSVTISALPRMITDS